MMLKMECGDQDNCFANVVNVISKKWNRENVLMFLDTWGIYYDDDPNAIEITDKIRPYYKSNYINHLKYQGINIMEYYTFNFDELLLEIRMRASVDYILVVCLDAYFCDWYFGYKTYHRKHVCIVSEIDGDDIILLDTFYTFRAEKMKISELRKAIKYYYTFEPIDPIQLNRKEEYGKLLYNALIGHSDKNSGMSISFEKTLLYLKDVNNIKKIYNDYPTIEANPLIYIFKLFQFYRKSFSKCLEYIESKSGIELKKYTDELLAICDIWENIRLILAKINLKYTEKSHQALLQQFTVVMELEQRLHDKLLAESPYLK